MRLNTRTKQDRVNYPDYKYIWLPEVGESLAVALGQVFGEVEVDSELWLLEITDKHRSNKLHPLQIVPKHLNQRIRKLLRPLLPLRIIDSLIRLLLLIQVSLIKRILL